MKRRNGSEYRSGLYIHGGLCEGRPEGLSGGSNRKGIELRAGGAALMTGAKFSFKRAENTYFDIKRNDKLNAIMTEQLAGLGITDLADGDRYHSAVPTSAMCHMHVPPVIVHWV